MIKNARFLTSAAVFALTIRAFDTGKAGWKLDKDGHIEMKDGNPIWIDANGGESTMSGDTITRLNGEAKQHRVAKEAAEAKLKDFEGIEPVEARKAIDMVKKIDAKKLIDTGEVDRLRKEIEDQFKTQIAEKDKAIADKDTRINNMTIDGIFNGSEFIKERVAMPMDFFQSAMRNHFKMGPDGKVEAYGKDGNRIFSKKRTGEYADPDEALEIIVESHPQRDMILKANKHSGSGSDGGGGHRPGSRNIRRADFEKMDAMEKASIATNKDITIVD